MAQEMTRGDLKTSRSGNRTPFQILADYYQAGNVCDRQLWHEYARVTRGLAAVRWSRGLRAAMLGPSAVPVRTDLELSADETDGELVANFPVAIWSAIRLAGLDLVVLAAAENGGNLAVHSAVAAVGQQLPN